MDPYQLRPLRLGELLDAAIKIYRQKFSTMLRAVAITLIPVGVLNLLVRLSLTPQTSTRTVSFGSGGTGTVTSTSGPSGAAVGGAVLLVVISMVASTLAEAACLKAVIDTYLGANSDWRSTLRFGFSKLGSLVWLLVLPGLLLGLAGTAMIVPAFLLAVAAGPAAAVIIVPLAIAVVVALVWLYNSWVVRVPALLVEDARGSRALRRSFELVRGRWWPVAGTMFVVQLMVGAATAVFSALLLAVAVTQSHTTYAVTAAATNTIAAVLTTPFSAAIVAVIYFDLRVRKEGFDLQLLAQRVGLPASAVTSPPGTPMPWAPQPQPNPWGPQWGSPAGPGWVPPPPTGGPSWGPQWAHPGATPSPTSSGAPPPVLSPEPADGPVTATPSVPPWQRPPNGTDETGPDGPPGSPAAPGAAGG
ncbi:MAG: hypothetical protein U0V73_01690 [Acidimicrobiia bacterium]